MQLVVETRGLEQAVDAINQAVAAFGRGEALDAVGAELESQTRRRIESEKSGPEGGRWANWSKGHARTRHGNQSLLQGSGALLDSIRNEVVGDAVEAGSNVVYAAAHQCGLDISILSTGRRVTIPARPFLGLSAENEADILEVVNDWLARKLA